VWWVTEDTVAGLMAELALATAQVVLLGRPACGGSPGQRQRSGAIAGKEEPSPKRSVLRKAARFPGGPGWLIIGLAFRILDLDVALIFGGSMVSALMRMSIGDGPDGVGGDFILAEVDRQDVGGPVQLAADDASGRDVARAPQTLADAFDRLGPALSTMLLKLRSAEHAPDEIQMEFGLKLGGETGLIFAKGTAEANFAVTVMWAKPAPSGPAHSLLPLGGLA
jgi:Trypsin-co-occurring domain 1